MGYAIYEQVEEIKPKKVSKLFIDGKFVVEIPDFSADFYHREIDTQVVLKINNLVFDGVEFLIKDHALVEVFWADVVKLRISHPTAIVLADKTNKLVCIEFAGNLIKD